MDMEIMGVIAVTQARIEQLQAKANAAEERSNLIYRAEVVPYQVAAEELRKVLTRLRAINQEEAK